MMNGGIGFVALAITKRWQMNPASDQRIYQRPPFCTIIPFGQGVEPHKLKPDQTG